MSQSCPPPGGTPFDPERGCQEPSTGVIGALFAVSLVCLYGWYQQVDPSPPVVAPSFPWPTGNLVTVVNRDYFDLLAILGLTFEGMALWELNRSRPQRCLFLGIGVSALLWSAAVVGGAPVSIGGGLTRMESVYALTALALLLPAAPGALTGLRGLRRYRHRVRHALVAGTVRWLAGAVVLGTVVAVATWHPFYATEYYLNWRLTAHLLFLLYLVLGLPYAFLANLVPGRDGSPDAGGILVMLGRAALGLHGARLLRLLRNRRTRAVLLDLLVKIYFVPVMVTFYYGNVGGVFQSLQTLRSFDDFYKLSYYGLFTMDVGVCLLGYLTASRWLGNKTSSVDSTMDGWVWALSCYPPLVIVTGSLLPYTGSHEGTPWLSFARLPLEGTTAVQLDAALSGTLKVVSLVAMGLYVWAQVGFGLRFSNLTNRGIITRGAYSMIRHPAYVGKNVAWWAETVLTFTSLWHFLFLVGWNVIYLLRALTEERHLSRDPNYRAYCERVRFRFIPGLW